MATKTGLVRSFYGWLVRKEQALREAENDTYMYLLPAQRPTSIPSVTRIALHAVRVLKGTTFEERAIYWAELFERIRAEGWRGERREIDTCQDAIRQELEEATRGRHLAV